MYLSVELIELPVRTPRAAHHELHEQFTRLLFTNCSCMQLPVNCLPQYAVRRIRPLHDPSRLSPEVSYAITLIMKPMFCGPYKCTYRLNICSSMEVHETQRKLREILQNSAQKISMHMATCTYACDGVLSNVRSKLALAKQTNIFLFDKHGLYERLHMYLWDTRTTISNAVALRNSPENTDATSSQVSAHSLSVIIVCISISKSQSYARNNARYIVRGCNGNTTWAKQIMRKVPQTNTSNEPQRTDFPSLAKSRVSCDSRVVFPAPTQAWGIALCCELPHPWGR
jgi:hypothetical protein